MSMNETADTASFFDDYVEDSLDPGWALIIGSLVACLVLHATLPCMLTLGSRYERQKTSKTNSDDNLSTDNDETSDEDEEKTKSDRTSKPSRQPSFLLEKMTSIAPTDPQTLQQASTSFSNPISTGGNKLTAIEEEYTADEHEFRQSDSSEPASMASLKLPNPSFGDGLLAMFCGFAETLDSAQLILPRTRRNFKRCDASSVSSASTTQQRIKQQRAVETARKVTSSEDVLSEMSQASTISRTVLSKLHQDDVSFTEALDKYHPSTIQYQEKEENEDSGEIDILCGERAWWKPKVVLSAIDKLIEISDVDSEMMALLRAAFPVSLQGFATGFFNLLDVSLIGYLVGAEEASIFVVVSILTFLPTSFAYGLFESLTKLVPLAIDQDQPKLAGTYLNTALVLFTFAMIPIGLFWSFLTTSTFLRLGFDEKTAALAQQYAFVQIGLEWISGIGYCIHLFLDVTGHERYSTCSSLVFGLLLSLAVVVQSLVGRNSLVNVGLCRVMFATIHVLCSSLLVLCWGWFDKYSSGIRRLLFTDLSALTEVSRTAVPLGVAYFLNYGEFDALTLFAAALGPAEVVAWAILSRLWSILTYTLSDGFADAAGNRSVLHLVSNNPKMARLSAGKSHFLGAFSSLLVTSIIFMLGIELSKLMSPDPTLQRLMAEIFPLLGLGNVVQTTGLISVSLLGAQERAGMAALISFLGNWCVAITLGSVFTFGLQVDLQGLASAVVLGLGLASTGNSFLVLRSQWNSAAIQMSQGLLKELELQEERDAKTDSGLSKRQVIL